MVYYIYIYMRKNQYVGYHLFIYLFKQAADIDKRIIIFEQLDLLHIIV